LDGQAAVDVHWTVADDAHGVLGDDDLVIRAGGQGVDALGGLRRRGHRGRRQRRQQRDSHRPDAQVVDERLSHDSSSFERGAGERPGRAYGRSGRPATSPYPPPNRDEGFPPTCDESTQLRGDWPLPWKRLAL